MEEAGIWIYESKERKRRPQMTKQRTKTRQGYPGKSIKAASKEQHHEDKEGDEKMV